MLKRNIKIILIGTLVLGFFGLIYSFLSSKPEIVSDTAMRSNEPMPPIPKLASELAPVALPETDANAAETNAPEPEPVSSDIAEVLEATKPEGGGFAEVGSEADVERIDSEIAQNELAAPVAVSTAVEPETTSPEPEADGSAMDVIAEEQTTGEPMLAVDSDVEVLPEQTGFIDLNLTETSPNDLRLIEGDDLILDDINEDLLKYQSVVSTVVSRQASPVEPATSGVSQMPVAEGEVTDQQGTDEQGAVAIAGATPELAVVSIAEPDDTLMGGDDALSQQYRETYAKLQLVTTKLSREDEKNKALKVRFVEAAGQNREMDEKINEINQKIIELTAKK